MTTRTLAAALALAALAACATLRDTFGSRPEGRPSGREGWLVYTVGDLRFEAPAGWEPRGDARHLKLEAPQWRARLEVSTPGDAFPDEKACLADADAALQRASDLDRARRHPTRFGGVNAVTLEGDAGGWHVWAWAACDGGRQYQIFFTSPNPVPAEALEAQRTLVQTARVGGES